jgi:hypothetical protein
MQAEVKHPNSESYLQRGGVGLGRPIGELCRALLQRHAEPP